MCNSAALDIEKRAISNRRVGRAFGQQAAGIPPQSIFLFFP
jgi:hypothetical protein